MPTNFKSVEVLLKFMAVLGLKEAQKVLKSRCGISAIAQMLKAAYSDPINFPGLVYKNNPFLKMLPKKENK